MQLLSDNDKVLMNTKNYLIFDSRMRRFSIIGGYFRRREEFWCKNNNKPEDDDERIVSNNKVMCFKVKFPEIKFDSHPREMNKKNPNSWVGNFQPKVDSWSCQETHDLLPILSFDVRHYVRFLRRAKIKVLPHTTHFHCVRIFSIYAR